jgi:hypothetical protein
MQIDIGKIYTFNTTAPSMLGTTVKNAKLIAIMDYQTAVQYDNIDLKYRSIYPLLPNGTPDRPDSSIYYRFLSESGEKIILADVWIQSDTLETVSHVSFQVTFTDTTYSDITKVKDALNALGYLNFQIKQL